MEAVLETVADRNIEGKQEENAQETQRKKENQRRREATQRWRRSDKECVKVTERKGVCV